MPIKNRFIKNLGHVAGEVALDLGQKVVGLPNKLKRKRKKVKKINVTSGAHLGSGKSSI